MLRSIHCYHWLRRERFNPAACPSAHCCCGGVWARRVHGPALTHGGRNTPCHLASHARSGFRWAPCRELNWDRDALAGEAALPSQPFGGSAAPRAWWWLILIALAILRWEWSVLLFKIPFISSTTQVRLWFPSSLVTTTTFTQDSRSIVVIVDLLIIQRKSITTLSPTHTSTTTHSK